MSDAFYAAVITANALFLSFGGLLVVNVTRDIEKLERILLLDENQRHKLKARRSFLGAMIIPLFLSTGFAILVSLEALAGVLVGGNSLVWGVVFGTIVNMFLLSVEVAGAYWVFTTF